MKKVLFGMALAALVALGVSCVNSSFVVRGSGKAVKGAFDIPLDYRDLSVVSGITVVLVPSETGEGYITADEEIMEYVSIVEKEGCVKVSYQPHISVRTGVETVVTMPISRALARVDVSSAAKVLCDTGLECRSLDIEVSSAAKCSLTVDCDVLRVDGSSAAKFEGKITARELHADFGSAAKCEVEGIADHCDVETGSASHFRGYELVCKKADLDASSAGSIEITVTEELVADVSSGGSVRYRGAPRIVHSDVSSGGSLKRD